MNLDPSTKVVDCYSYSSATPSKCQIVVGSASTTVCQRLLCIEATKIQHRLRGGLEQAAQTSPTASSGKCLGCQLLVVVSVVVLLSVWFACVCVNIFFLIVVVTHCSVVDQVVWVARALFRMKGWLAANFFR